MLIMVAASLPMVDGIHVLLARSYGAKESYACVALPHLVLLYPIHFEWAMLSDTRGFAAVGFWIGIGASMILQYQEWP